MRREEGFTLIEVAVVLALIVFLTAIAVPNLSAYQRRQSARNQTQSIAGVLAEARALAIKEGNPYYVQFTSDPNSTVEVVDDDDGDFQWDDPPELKRKIVPFRGASPGVTYYNAAPGPPTATTVAEEGSTAIPSTGITFPIDAVSGDPGIAFNSQGFPLSMPASVGGPPGAPGSGAGSYYVTDNDEVVYAVTLSPLGAARVRVYRSTMSDWY